MERVILKRVLQGNNGTFGVIIYKDEVLCVTCEDPWNDNKQGVSCIPTGLYKCIPHSGDKFKNVWRVINVPGRDAILFAHAGNTIKDTHGCVLVGLQFSRVDGLPGITSSVMAVNLLRGILPKEFNLVIID